LYSYRTTGVKNLPTLEDIMLKRDKEEIFLVFANSFSSQVVGVVSWRKNCVKMAISGMVTISDEAFVLLLLENYRENWSTKNVEEYKAEKWHMTKPQIKRKRGKQHRVNLLVVPGVPNGLEGGPWRASYDSSALYRIRK